MWKLNDLIFTFDFTFFQLVKCESTDDEIWKLKEAEECGRVTVETDKRKVQTPGSIASLDD